MRNIWILVIWTPSSLIGQKLLTTFLQHLLSWASTEPCGEDPSSRQVFSINSIVNVSVKSRIFYEVGVSVPCSNLILDTGQDGVNYLDLRY